jgi:Mn2+/Fe2+ NRAMP family transporter
MEGTTMVESNRRKYMVWATIAFAVLAVDVAFAFALGNIVSWIARLASPFVWGGLAAVALVSWHVVRVLCRNPLRRVELEPQA